MIDLFQSVQSIGKSLQKTSLCINRKMKNFARISKQGFVPLVMH